LIRGNLFAALGLTSLLKSKGVSFLDAPQRIEPSRAAIVAAFKKECADGMPHNIRELLLPLLLEVSTSPYLLADSLGMWRFGEERFWIPRFVFQRTQRAKRRIKVGIFAGVHGDEPEAVLGLVDLVRALNRRPEIAREYQLWIYPVCNPSGFVDGTRRSRAGLI
jgi:Predicted deacylase